MVFPLLLCLAGLRCAIAQASAPPAGNWKGIIQTPAGAVEFVVEIQASEGAKPLSATLVNGTDRQPFTSAAWDGQTLTLRIDYYDGTLTAHLAGDDRLEAEYSRLTSKGVIHVPVHLQRQPPVAASGASACPNPPQFLLAGEWLLHRTGDSGLDKVTPARLEESRGEGCFRIGLRGTLEPVSGDSGLLNGAASKAKDGGPHFHLSRFDGIHILALDGDVLPDGTLRGTWADNALEAKPFTGNRKAETAVDTDPDSGSITQVRDPREPFAFAGIDAAGNRVDHTSELFKGKPLIIDIFGTWCPNCHDEAPVLQHLYEKYHSQGLQIVGLAYEYTDDQVRDLRQIGIYRQKYGITFPLLLAGTTAKGQIESTLPQLVNFGAYPTTIFLGRDGRVHAIHPGFSGPATGAAYQRVQDEMDRLTREIVKAVY